MTAFLASEGSRRQRKRAQTANPLSATAFRLFETHGYDVVAMEQIAAEADVAKATLYTYFPGKETLLEPRFREDIAAVIAEREAPTAAHKTTEAPRGGREWVDTVSLSWVPFA